MTLVPRKAFAFTRPVQLRVIGQPPSGLHDSGGRLIDGDRDGQPGGNAVAVLGRVGVTMSVVDAILADASDLDRPMVVGPSRTSRVLR